MQCMEGEHFKYPWNPEPWEVWHEEVAERGDGRVVPGHEGGREEDGAQAAGGGDHQAHGPAAQGQGYTSQERGRFWVERCQIFKNRYVPNIQE